MYLLADANLASLEFIVYVIKSALIASSSIDTFVQRDGNKLIN